MPTPREELEQLRAKAKSQAEILNPTGRRTAEGRPIFTNQQGQFVTERTITENIPELGGVVNIPTVFEGRFLSPDEAVQKVIESDGKDPITGRKLQVFSDIPTAVESAKQRSSGLGHQINPRDELEGLRMRQRAIELGAQPGVALTPEQLSQIQQGQQITPERRLPETATGFRPLPETEERGIPGAILSGAQLGATRIGAGLARTFTDVDPSDLQAVMAAEEAQLGTPERPISQFVGEVVGETLAFPVGGAGKTLTRRALTAAGAGATAGALSEAGRGGDIEDIAVTSLVGGAFGPVGEVLGDVISKGGARAANVFRKVFRSKGQQIPPNLITQTGELAPDAVEQIQKMGITEADFRAAFSNADIEDLTGLDAASAFRTARARREGVQLSRGQATRGFEQAEAEDILKSSATAEGQKARGFFTQQQDDLVAAKDRFLVKLTDDLDLPRPERGADVRKTLIDINEAERLNVTNLYRELAELPGGQTRFKAEGLEELRDQLIRDYVPSDGVQKGLDNIFEDFGITPGGEQSKTFQGPLNFKNAEKLRQRLNKLKSTDSKDIAVITQMKQGLDDLVSGATEQFPENTAIGEAARRARQAASERIKTFQAKDIIEDLTSFKTGTQTERIADEQIFDKLFTGNRKIDNIKRVKNVLLKNPTKQSTKAWKEIQAQGMLDLFGKAINETPDGFTISGTKLNSAVKKFGDDALNQLFTAKQLKAFRQLQSVVGDATIPVPRTTQPSGTAKRIFNVLGRMFNASGDGLTGKAASMLGAGAGAIKNAAQRQEVVNGILKGATPTVKANTLLRMAISIPSTRAAIIEQRELREQQ